MQKMTLYDHVLMWAMARRAKHHGVDLKNGIQVETRAVRMMGDADGVHFAEGVEEIPPAIMPQIIEAMGWMPSREQHDPACPKQVDSDATCNCVQPPTMWTAPDRVQKYMGEDYATALAERQSAS